MLREDAMQRLENHYEYPYVRRVQEATSLKPQTSNWLEQGGWGALLLNLIYESSRRKFGLIWNLKKKTCEESWESDRNWVEESQWGGKSQRLMKETSFLGRNWMAKFRIFDIVFICFFSLREALLRYQTYNERLSHGSLVLVHWKK